MFFENLKKFEHFSDGSRLKNEGKKEGKSLSLSMKRFRCPFRVGIEVLLAARLGQRPQVGRVALLSA